MQSAVTTEDLDLTTLAPKGEGLFDDLNRLREQDPLYWSEASHCWIVTGHVEVFEGFSGQLPLSNKQFPDALYRVMGPEEQNARLRNALHYITPWVTNSDAPEHTRRRKLLTKAFGRKIVEGLRPYVQERVAMLMDKADAAAGEIEFNEEIARMLPGAVILRLFGMSEDYMGRLKDWADAFGNGLGSFHPAPELLDLVEQAVIEMVPVFTAEIEDRRRSPKDDLISELINAVDGGDQLTVDEVIGTLILLIVAGHDTTSNTMTLGLRSLARNPEAWSYWRQHPENGLECANELMRYTAMSTTIPRLAAEDFDWHGRQIRKGDMVMLMIAGGNRDPSAYPDPERFDPTRPNDKVLTFGPGPHHCVGHLLAKLQVTEFFSALTQRFIGVEVLEAPVFMHALVFRGVNALKVRFVR